MHSILKRLLYNIYYNSICQDALEAQGNLPEGAHMALLSAEEEHFEVELLKDAQGLGITIAGYVGDKTTGKLYINFWGL